MELWISSTLLLFLFVGPWALLKLAGYPIMPKTRKLDVLMYEEDAREIQDLADMEGVDTDEIARRALSLYYQIKTEVLLSGKQLAAYDNKEDIFEVIDVL